MRVNYKQAIVTTSLELLSADGRRGVESVVLWLGNRDEAGVQVQEVFRPNHSARSDQFWIAEVAMDELKTHLRRTRQFVAAQLHTHPQLAFHSSADDRWAIIRHEGALSMVLPFFARATTASTFRDDVRAFRMSEHATWAIIDPLELGSFLCLI